MPRLLLTGAGFSYNWGGYLASEAFEFLLSVTDGDDDLRSLLWRDHQAGLGFEDSLAKLQHEFAHEWSAQREQDLRNLTSAVQQMFGSMAQAFSKTPFGTVLDNPLFGVVNFLSKFHVIFTLNQDTLLEQQYIPHADQNTLEPFLTGHRYAYRPGITESHDKSTYGAVGGQIELFMPKDKLELVPRLQPYIKLHGSIDIKASDHEMMLVIGGNKAANVAEQPLLRWYHELFKNRLREPEARLMIIGYSFGDAHINDLIFGGIEAGLKIFIVDPLGVDVIGSNRSLPLNPAFQVRNAIIGASRRSIRNTLTGSDPVELNKIHRFLGVGVVR
jgi:hypothetical protein